MNIINSQILIYIPLIVITIGSLNNYLTELSIIEINNYNSYFDIDRESEEMKRNTILIENTLTFLRQEIINLTYIYMTENLSPMERVDIHNQITGATILWSQYSGVPIENILNMNFLFLFTPMCQSMKKLYNTILNLSKKIIKYSLIISLVTLMITFISFETFTDSLQFFSGKNWMNSNSLINYEENLPAYESDEEEVPDYNLTLQLDATQMWIRHRHSWSQDQLLEDILKEHVEEKRTDEELNELIIIYNKLRLLGDIDLSSLLFRIETWTKILDGDISIKDYIKEKGIQLGDYDPEHDEDSSLLFLPLFVSQFKMKTWYKKIYNRLLTYLKKMYKLLNSQGFHIQVYLAIVMSFYLWDLETQIINNIIDASLIMSNPLVAKAKFTLESREESDDESLYDYEINPETGEYEPTNTDLNDTNSENETVLEEDSTITQIYISMSKHFTDLATTFTKTILETIEEVVDEEKNIESEEEDSIENSMLPFFLTPLLSKFKLSKNVRTITFLIVFKLVRTILFTLLSISFLPLDLGYISNYFDVKGWYKLLNRWWKEGSGTVFNNSQLTDEVLNEKSSDEKHSIEASTLFITSRFKNKYIQYIKTIIKYTFNIIAILIISSLFIIPIVSLIADIDITLESFCLIVYIKSNFNKLLIKKSDAENIELTNFKVNSTDSVVTMGDALEEISRLKNSSILHESLISKIMNTDVLNYYNSFNTSTWFVSSSSSIVSENVLDDVLDWGDVLDEILLSSILPVLPVPLSKWLIKLLKRVLIIIFFRLLFTLILTCLPELSFLLPTTYLDHVGKPLPPTPNANSRHLSLSAYSQSSYQTHTAGPGRHLSRDFPRATPADINDTTPVRYSEVSRRLKFAQQQTDHWNRLDNLNNREDLIRKTKELMYKRYKDQGFTDRQINRMINKSVELFYTDPDKISLWDKIRNKVTSMYKIILAPNTNSEVIPLIKKDSQWYDTPALNSKALPQENNIVYNYYKPNWLSRLRNLFKGK